MSKAIVTPIFLSKISMACLSSDDARQLHIANKLSLDSGKLHPKLIGCETLVLNYIDPLTNEPTGFWRARILDRPRGQFGEELNQKLRYVQPIGSGVHAYFPSIVDWPAIFSDVSRDLFITEGELKACAATKLGYPTIALGGVFNWMSTKKEIDFIDDLKLPKWQGRKVYIIFDSDVVSNPMVAMAQSRLAIKLSQLGALPRMVELPPAEDGAKQGLDDFILATQPHSKSLLDALLQDPDKTRSANAAVQLWKMNDLACIVLNPGLIVNRDNDSPMSREIFTNLIYADRRYTDFRVSAKGDVKQVEVSVPTEWLKWPFRLSRPKLDYVPGQPKLLDHCYNVWPGWGVEPETDSIVELEDLEPFMRLLDILFLPSEGEVRNWLLKWLALPLQQPGIKMQSAVLFWSHAHGVGKSMLGETMGIIYGQNYVAVNQTELDESFNTWAERKQFVLFDDVTRIDKRGKSDVFKTMITREKIFINTKYVPGYYLTDTINYMITSNQPDVIYVEPNDRRHLIHEVKSKPADHTFYRDYRQWLRNGGAAIVARYLRDLDVGDFNQATWPPMTDDKRAMIMLSETDLASWLSDLDDGFLASHGKQGRELFTSGELAALYDVHETGKWSPHRMTKELAKLGYKLVNRGSPVLNGIGGQAKYFAVKNIEYWHQQPPSVIAAHVRPQQTTVSNLQRKY